MAHVDVNDVKIDGTGSASGYLRASVLSWQTLRWTWQELLSSEGRTQLLKMVAWATCRNIVLLMLPYFLSTTAVQAAVGNYDLARQQALYFLGTIAASHLIRLLQDYGLEGGVLDMLLFLDLGLNRRFFDKSLAQHRTKGNMLDASNVEKARGRVWETVGMLLWQGTDALTQITAAMLFLWAICPQAGVAMSLTVCAFLVSMVLLNRKVLEIGSELDREERLLNMRRADLWEHARLVIWANAVDREVEYLFRRGQAITRRLRRLWIPYITAAGLRGMLVGIIVALIVYRGVTWIERGVLAADLLIPVGIWALQLAAALEQVRGLDRIINWNTPTIRAVRETLETPNDVPEHPEAVPVTAGDLPIEVSGVSYNYPGGRQVLHDVSLSLKPGERVALVGKSGSGKTTIARLLMREMDPAKGSIHVAGPPLRRLTLASWRGTAGHIPQEAQVVSDTIRANLLFTLHPDAAAQWTDEALWRVLESVELGDRERLEDGLDTVLGKRGIDLSGGERQRLMVARALVKRPRFLIVDEATSSLDGETEEVVQRGIDTMLAAGSSAVIIAHRLATIEHVDRVIVLSEGRIIDQGPHAEVYARCALFRSLCEKQKISYSLAS